MNTSFDNYIQLHRLDMLQMYIPSILSINNVLFVGNIALTFNLSFIQNTLFY